MGEITKAQKAAIILMSLGDELASEVVRHLDPEQIKSITEEISRIGTVSGKTKDSILSEFYNMLRGVTLIGGKEKAKAIMGRFNTRGMMTPSMIDREAKESLQILKAADPFAILETLKDDQPQTIALVLRQLSPMKASRILRDLSPDIRDEVIERLTRLENPSSEALQGIARVLSPKLRLATSKDEIRRSSGIGIASTILSYIGGEEAKEILEKISAKSPETAEKMKDLIFTFDDISLLDDRAVQRVMRDVDRKDLVVSFKAASEKIKQKILNNMSERAREEFMEQFETLGPVRLADVEESQRKIVEVVRKLDADGEISIVKEKEGEFV